MRRKRQVKVARKRVVSAGGVVLRGDPPEVLVVSLKGGRVTTLPKGQVEPGERYPETAVREVREETGVEAAVLSPLGKVRYYFTVRDGEELTTVSKEVHYFLMAYRGGKPRPQLSEVEAAYFLPVTEALERLSYPNEREMVRKALLRLGRG
ncbi:MAG: NUDIX hydrolase [Thermus sp.]|uniref:NUDIX hydrolase n=1 Tax=unclassified Thermus TaxID=2619321 RepID=UPI00023894DE|nr:MULTISPECIES: NUDIX hydrolase [unclassified Thermus]AEV16894.1 Bis(5'-nucleosyl)-tetraphosphatase [Thermus sp. CCB_US3_UF1]MCS6868639.1 NUDIX hydrolase [Thermus sp.]MCS7218249.1 NUDIX hydrolase [Thermus sp.]MCX7850104.1 NUDIX hydrolase [Thermus sp.]MDW8017038.1 NUDIX hydrolase [Thermus sp.]